MGGDGLEWKSERIPTGGLFGVGVNEGWKEDDRRSLVVDLRPREVNDHVMVLVLLGRLHNYEVVKPLLSY